MVKLLGFNDESISFEVSGQQGLDIARLCGAPFGYEPRFSSVAVAVTIFREGIDFGPETSYASPRGEPERYDLFNCSDPDCSVKNS